MAIEMWYPYAVDIDGTLVDAVPDHTINPGIALEQPAVDGQVDPKMTLVNALSPTVALQTLDIGAGLNAIGGANAMSGQVITYSSAEVAMFCQRQSHGATRDGASSHLKVALQSGLIIPVSANVGNDGPGLLEMLCILRHDGTNEPVAFTASQSLAGTPAGDVGYWCGPVKLNNVDVDSVQAIRIDFGISPVIRRHGGSVQPRFVGVQRRTPQITVTTDDVDLVNTYFKSVAIASATHVYFRKGTSAVDRVAEGTAGHCKFTVNDGAISAGAAGGNPQSLDIMIRPHYDGSNAIIVIDTASAIT